MQLHKRKYHVLLLGRNQPGTSTDWGGKRMTWAVHEPVTCPYGKGDQRPLELHLAEHHQQVQAGDPHLLPNSHIAEVLKGDMDMLD